MAVIFITSGPGCHNTDARRTAGYLRPIPTALTAPLARLKQLQDHFGLLNHGPNPKYLDFLDKDAILLLGIDFKNSISLILMIELYMIHMTYIISVESV